MTQLRQLLAALVAGGRPSFASLQETLKRVRRRERFRQLGTAALALVLFGTAGVFVWQAFSPVVTQETGGAGIDSEPIAPASLPPPTLESGKTIPIAGRGEVKDV